MGLGHKFSQHCQTNRSGAESTMQAYILCPYKYPRPMGWDQKVIIFKLKVAICILELNGM